MYTKDHYKKYDTFKYRRKLHSQRVGVVFGGISMKDIIAIFILVVVVTTFASDRAPAQSSSCPTGTCPYAVKAAVRPFAGGQVSGMQDMSPLEKQIVQIEKDALEKWYVGDPSAYNAILGDEVGYFDPSAEKRWDGKELLSKMFEAQRGKIHADKFEMLNTRVQSTAEVAVLTFNLLLLEGGIPYRWNCSEVFGLQKDGKWKIIHSHWSLTKPQIK
jgi:ketosteroid isomerase-like protein